MEDEDYPSKRQRVSHACDECRKRKVRCDGQQPCAKCREHSTVCLFSEITTKRTREGPTKTEKLKYTEGLLRILFPNVDLYNPGVDLESLLRSSGRGAITIATAPKKPVVDERTKFVSMLPKRAEAMKLLRAGWDNACVLFKCYHEPTFLEDLDVLYTTNANEYTGVLYRKLGLTFAFLAVGALFKTSAISGPSLPNSPGTTPNGSTQNSSVNGHGRTHELGSSATMGLPDLSSMVSLSPDHDSSEGYKYFTCAQKLIDLVDTKDVDSIQAIVMMTMFLQCSARLSNCYAYVGVALRSVIRLGFHRKNLDSGLNPVEREVRKRLFWTVRKMDVYINAMLGVPRGIDDRDFDQVMPLDLEDEDITRRGFRVKPGARSRAGREEKVKVNKTMVSNRHTALLEILSHVMRDIYPARQSDHSYETICERTDAIARELQVWLERLPPELKPGTTLDENYIKANRLLALCFCYVQIVLYRPFIHYSSPQFQNSRDKTKVKEYAQKCVAVARQIMYLANDMVSRNILNGAYWFTTYAIFFGVAILLYYVHENSTDSSVYTLMKDAEMGKQALNRIKASSQSATRTFELLNAMFDQLNKKTLGLKRTNTLLAPLPRADSLLTSTRPRTTSEDSGLLGATSPDPLQAIMESAPVSLPQVKEQEVDASISSVQNGLSGLNENVVNTAPLDSAKRPSLDMSDGFYIPGFMDQVDTLFGRFVPPYMMQQSDEPDIMSELLTLPDYTTSSEFSSLGLGYDFNDYLNMKMLPNENPPQVNVPQAPNLSGSYQGLYTEKELANLLAEREGGISGLKFTD